MPVLCRLESPLPAVANDGQLPLGARSGVTLFLGVQQDLLLDAIRCHRQPPGCSALRRA